jgi:hypothetical protein
LRVAFLPPAVQDASVDQAQQGAVVGIDGDCRVQGEASLRAIVTQRGGVLNGQDMPAFTMVAVRAAAVSNIIPGLTSG